MTTKRMNAGMRTAKFQTFFKPRDIFLHDGKSLRRFTIGARIQMAVVVARFRHPRLVGLRHVPDDRGDERGRRRDAAPGRPDADRYRRDPTATAQRAALLERRQAFLAEMLSGHAEPDRLAQMLPAAADPENPAAQAITDAFARVDSMQADSSPAPRRRPARAIASAPSRSASSASARPLPGAEHGVGGPYEPVAAVDNADPRFRELFTTWRQLDQLQQGVAAIPSAIPLHNAVNFTSGYGIRSDPFRGRAAMHAGIDLAGPLGTPIYATADGIVGRSEWNNGGYGNLVEIDQARASRPATATSRSASPSPASASAAAT